MRNRRSTFRLRASLCGIVGVVITLAGCRQNISGSYLASDKSAVCWLQLVRTPDNHLTGQLAASVLKPDGSIERNTTSVTGAVDGENVSLSGSGILGLQSFTLAGTLDGGTLTLSGAQSVPMTLKRSTLATYQAQLADLNNRAQGIVKEKAIAQAQQRAFEGRQAFVGEIDSLISKMNRFDSQADIHLGRFPGAEKAYESITAKVGEYVERERQLARNQNASVERGQLSVAASQAFLSTEQIHNQCISLESSLDSEIKPLADQVSNFEQKCHSVPTLSGRIVVEELSKLTEACVRLGEAVAPFREKYGAMSSGLAHLDQVYQKERTAQESLIQESERLE
jgi:hypothetical protein